MHGQSEQHIYVCLLKISAHRTVFTYSQKKLVWWRRQYQSTTGMALLYGTYHSFTMLNHGTDGASGVVQTFGDVREPLGSVMSNLDV